jgi:uncharacterized protein (TIGR02246 family)
MYRPFASSLATVGTFVDVESTIRGLTQDLSTAFNTGNYDHVAAAFAIDGQFMAPNREPAIGAKPIERMLREIGEAGYQDLRFETLRVEYSDDLAVEVGRYTVSVAMGNGTTSIERGKYVHAWRRLGTWLMFASCWSSNQPVVKKEPAAQA